MCVSFSGPLIIFLPVCHLSQCCSRLLFLWSPVQLCFNGAYSLLPQISITRPVTMSSPRHPQNLKENWYISDFNSIRVCLIFSMFPARLLWKLPQRNKRGHVWMNGSSCWTNTVKTTFLLGPKLVLLGRRLSGLQRKDTFHYVGKLESVWIVQGNTPWSGAWISVAKGL